MKKHEAFELLQGLRAVATYKGAKFAYCVAKNLVLVSDECARIDKLAEPSPSFIEYDKARVSLAAECAEVSADGSPIIQRNEYVITARRAEFEARLAELNGAHAEAIAVRQKEVDYLNVMLADESDLELFTITVDSLPDDITAAELVSIMPILREDA